MDRLLASGLVLAVVAVATQTAVHLLNAAFIESARLDANGEGNPIAWAHGVAIFSCAFVCGLHALLVRLRRGTFVALAAILALLSLDEVAEIHEWIVGGALEVLGLTATWDSVVWPVLYAPLLGGLFVLLLAVARAAPRRPGRYMLVGLGLLTAALLAEVVSAPVSSGTNWPHTIEGAFEEGAEIGGWIAIASGLTVIVLMDLHLAMASDRTDQSGKDEPSPGRGSGPTRAPSRRRR
jgi:hypothetical protein